MTESRRPTSRARQLRNGATLPEQHLWRLLAKRQLGGHKFSRQMPVGPYFADFLCRERALIVELDGSHHDQQAIYDARRTAFLHEQGFTVVRFTNVEAMEDTDRVLAAIQGRLDESPSRLSARATSGRSTVE